MPVTPCGSLLLSVVDDVPIEAQLVRDGLVPEIEIVDTKIEPTFGDDDFQVRIEMRIEEELVASCALGVIFVLGSLSFQDGRPRGASEAWFEDADVFTAADLLRHLRYPNGRLQLDVDYLRGRCIKTEVDVWRDGRVRLETVNRGQAATRWVDRLRGKRVLTLVKGP
jgi:hypothetical protein